MSSSSRPKPSSRLQFTDDEENDPIAEEEDPSSQSQDSWSSLPPRRRTFGRQAPQERGPPLRQKQQQQTRKGEDPKSSQESPSSAITVASRSTSSSRSTAAAAVGTTAGVSGGGDGLGRLRHAVSGAVSSFVDRLSASKAKSSKPDKGEEALQRLMERAQYEILIDPYRGMVAHYPREEDAPQGERMTGIEDENAVEYSPWKLLCEVARHDDSLPPRQRQRSIGAQPPATAADWVRQATRTSCPCLEQWTAEAGKGTIKARKARKHAAIFCGQALGECPLGLRISAGSVKPLPDPPGSAAACATAKSSAAEALPAITRRLTSLSSQLRCACDYNPFCLVTVGGVMDTLLADAASGVSSGDFVLSAPHNYRSGRVVERLLRQASFYSEEELDVGNPLCVYSAETKGRMAEVRLSSVVPEQKVQEYLKARLHNQASAYQFTKLLKKMHADLVFRSPLGVEAADSDCEVVDQEPAPTMNLALPPGIGNLGATCYLNTQLQCLAQCLVFLSGVLQWRPAIAAGASGNPNGASGGNTRMQTVLRSFQRLLANLHAGSQRTYHTIEFSDALGLDHLEQQDPNEFARLFLERMDEAFQQTANAKLTDGPENGGYNLRDLLSHLFQGDMRYETTCDECGTRSYRHEKFRDLNLPIVEPPVSGKKGTLMDFFCSTNQDATVQDCLDRYCQAEDLAGDNQYHCSVCEKKCDARRQMSFTHLPHVLNIQLCRYVFDRKSLSKKKLSDKVLLPLELLVSSRKTEEQRRASSPSSSSRSHEDDSDEATTNRYLLCAVMRHLGNSAYSGHYVAEAMDWLTGQWYEFNDEQVTILESGPSCSFRQGQHVVPSTNIETTPPKGSKDAYNMYYVEESFLAQSIIDYMQELNPEQPQALKTPVTSTAEGWRAEAPNSEGQSGVLGQVKGERRAFYAELGRMCTRDGQSSRSRIRQRIGLRAKVLPDLEALEVCPSEEPVWVHGEQLRRYLEFDFSQSIKPRRSLLCAHRKPGLHPRIARKGKLIPRDMYNALVEKNESWFDGTTEMREQDRSGVLITPTSNMDCQDCREEYCKDLESKLHRIACLKELYDLFDTKAPAMSLELDCGDQPTCEWERYAYVVSKSFMASFRKRFISLLKTVAAADAMISIDSPCIDETECTAEGLDSLSSELLSFHDAPAGPTEREDAIDRFVNSSLACPHMRFIDRNQRLYQHFSHQSWELIQSLFPEAVCFRKRRYLKGESPSGGDEMGCPDCEAKESTDDNRLKRIRRLIELAKTNNLTSLDMSAVVNKERSLSGAQEPGTYWIVHTEDLEGWNRFMRSTRSMRSDSVEKLLKILSPKTSCSRERFLRQCSIDLGPYKQKLDMLASVLRPIVCSKHGLSIANALFARTVDPEYVKLVDRAVALDEDSYRSFIMNLVTLVVILSPLSENEDVLDRSISEDTRDAEDMVANLDLLNSLHPRFRRPSFSVADPSLEIEKTSRIVGSAGSTDLQFDMSPCFCLDPGCIDEFVAWESSEFEDKRIPGKVNAIEIDSDIELIADPSLFLRVFEIEAHADVEAEFPNLALAVGADTDDASAGDERHVRRSRRKRKPVYPIGAVVGDEKVRTTLDHNLSALRLALMQACTDFEPNHILKAFVVTPDPDHVPVEESVVIEYNIAPPMLPSKLIDLSFSMNRETLRGICETTLEKRFESDFKPEDRLFLVRQRAIDHTSLDANQEELLEVLIDASNNKDAKVRDNVKSRRSASGKAPERGFSGTFLTGAASIPNPTANCVDSPRSRGLRELASSDDGPDASKTQYGGTKESHEEERVEPDRNQRPLNQASASFRVNGEPGPVVNLLNDRNDVRGTFSRMAEPPASDPPSGKRPRKDLRFNGFEPIRVDDSDETSEDEKQLLKPVFSPRRTPCGATESSGRDGQSLSTPRRLRNGQNRGASVAEPDGERGTEKDQLVSSLVDSLQRLEWMTDTMFAQVLEAAQWAVETNPQQNRVDELETIATFKLAELIGRF